jgi:3-oxoacyl-(acyl-carrier-protein) synthase
VLLDEVPRGAERDVHVLFAGGIHDARSAAAVAALAAPLAARGMRVGVLMGSAYLFTEEIVATGAIVPEFQAQALACRRTANLETGPGHATRCAATAFAEEFLRERRRLIREGTPADELRDRLEDLNLGRLRLASKGRQRNAQGELVAWSEEEQRREGMYMIGQVATLRAERTTLEALHREVSEGGASRLAALVPARIQVEELPRPSDVAIVGIGTLLPGAQDRELYWRQIVDRVNAICEIPKSRWDWRLYFDEDRRARDRIYSKWGGFLEEVAFDPTRFGIPPNALRSIDPLQLLTLEVVRRALEDGGYAGGEFDREHTSVILGASGGLGDVGVQYGVRSEIARFVENPPASVWERLPEWTEESFAGVLLNVSAGRVANRFDLGGSNFTVDAACASSLAAIQLGVAELESGRSNVAIAGGVDTVQSPFGFLCFSKTQALSPRGRARTFDANGDGIVISEGLAVVVMKRLADAERDGDRVYATIKAVAGSSDGRALGLTAPRTEGQARAVARAYRKAGVSPATLGMIEAHGTGTPVGDRTEAETMIGVLRAAQAPPKSCAIGSVKTLIGHT